MKLYYYLFRVVNSTNNLCFLVTGIIKHIVMEILSHHALLCNGAVNGNSCVYY